MTLRWYRSWPEIVPPGRAYIHDHLERLVMTDHDYATATLPGDQPGFCMLEWDIALASEGRRRFAEVALTQPGRILVAPYCIYPVGGPPAGVHRTAGWPITPGTPEAETFGLGCIYLPAAILDRWRADMAGERLTDRAFSTWHLRTYGRARVTWAVSPQHLHGD